MSKFSSIYMNDLVIFVSCVSRNPIVQHKTCTLLSPFIAIVIKSDFTENSNEQNVTIQVPATVVFKTVLIHEQF